MHGQQHGNKHQWHSGNPDYLACHDRISLSYLIDYHLFYCLMYYRQSYCQHPQYYFQILDPYSPDSSWVTNYCQLQK